jgi:hypothetical protein
VFGFERIFFFFFLFLSCFGCFLFLDHQSRFFFSFFVKTTKTDKNKNKSKKPLSQNLHQDLEDAGAVERVEHLLADRFVQRRAWQPRHPEGGCISLNVVEERRCCQRERHRAVHELGGPPQHRGAVDLGRERDCIDEEKNYNKARASVF